MKNKKILKVSLVTLMSLSLFTGCVQTSQSAVGNNTKGGAAIGAAAGALLGNMIEKVH